MSISSSAMDFTLRRRDVSKRLSEGFSNNVLVITGLGSTNWDFTAAGDRDLTFPLWGAMGGAVPIGLGLALAKPEYRIVVATGDGEMLMGLGSLATVAGKSPKNMAIVVFDNEHYGETGMQASATAHKTNIEAIANGCGISVTGTVRNDEELNSAIPHILKEPGPSVYVIKVRAETLNFVLPPKDGSYLKDRFRRALLGDVGLATG